MPLPKPFATIAEVSEYLGCTQHVVVQWAAAEMIAVQVPVTCVECDGHAMNGWVTVTGSDLLRAYPFGRKVKKTCRLQRVYYPEHAAWLAITDPAGGIIVRTACLMISVDQVCAFMRKHGLQKAHAPRPATTTEAEAESTDTRTRGRQSPYPWDDFYAALTKYIHDEGVPESQAELVRVMQGWFARRARQPADIPGHRTIQDKVAKVYRLLHDDPPEDDPPPD